LFSLPADLGLNHNDLFTLSAVVVKWSLHRQISESMKRLRNTCLLLLGFACMHAHASEPLHVAAAADLTYCIDALSAAFGKQETGAQIKVSLGASGNFVAQIRNGAPFDVFLSADMAYPAQLAKEGAGDGTTLFTYAIGRAVIWSLDARFDLQRGMRVFSDPRLTRVAIANPDVAPYGRAAKAALEHYAVWDAVKPKLVIGENIAQTAQFIQTGNAQLGIVSLTTVLAPKLKGQGNYVLVPDAGLPTIEQGAILTSHGKDNPLAARFLRFLQSPAARAILERSGFALPPQHG
jgi:molybdate transport system substrate-binding protein